VGICDATLEGLGVTSAFWQDRRVLITGHTGFKGSWLALWLARLGAKVTGYALAPPTTPNLFKLVDVGSYVHSIVGDVRDLEQIRRVLRGAKPEIIIHMAAQSLVRESYRSPLDTIATNVMGTVNLLEAVRHASDVRAVVVVTSDKCYENREQVAGYRESDPMGGHDPYSSSKGAAELITSSYRRSFFHAPGHPAIATARAGNVIGGGDFATDRLIPDCIRATETTRPVSIRNPESIRPWQFVLEPLAGYLHLAQRLAQDGFRYGGAWNFGPLEDEPHTVRWLCDRFAAMLAVRVNKPFGVNLDHHEGDQHEASYLRLDISKAREKLNWHPVLSLDDAVAMTAAWYAEYLNGGDVPRMTADQIEQFQALTRRQSA